MDVTAITDQQQQQGQELAGLGDTSSPARRIPSLDGLRAISILMVLVGHCSMTFGVQSRWSQFLLHLAGRGQTGVSIFFVLSGFLITTLLLKEQDRNGGISIPAFYARRAFRILPAFYFYLLVLATLAFAGRIELNRRGLGPAALFLWNYLGGPGQWYVGHSWSLSVEEQFYLLWPLLLVILGRGGAARLALGIILVEPAVRVATYVCVPSLRAQIAVMGHTRADMLMFGCLVALIWRSPRAARWFKLAEQPGALALATLIVFFATPLLEARLRGAYLLSIGYTLEGLGISILLIHGVLRPAGVFGRLLNWRPLEYVGVRSYSIYLWQQLFLTPLTPAPWGRLPLNLILCFVAGEISFRFVETPFLRLRSRLSASRR